MPSGELYTAADAKFEREQKMKKRGYAIASDFIDQGITKAKARRMAKIVNSMVKLLGKLMPEERRKVLSQYL
jgi:hypothetical protein